MMSMKNSISVNIIYFSLFRLYFTIPIERRSILLLQKKSTQTQNFCARQNAVLGQSSRFEREAPVLGAKTSHRVKSECYRACFGSLLLSDALFERDFVCTFRPDVRLFFRRNNRPHFRPHGRKYQKENDLPWQVVSFL